MTLKVEQNTQILNFKSIVLNQEGFSKPKFILPHHNLVCRTSYPKKRKKNFFVYSLVLSKWQIPVCVLTIFHELVSADHTVAVGIHAWENWLDFLLHINPVVRLWFNSNHVVDGICNLTKDFEVNLEAILVWF